MIRLEFKPDDPDSDSGFESGDLRLSGEAGECSFYCMVVLSASLLMDQLIRDWSIKSPQWAFELNPVDCSGWILFKKDRDDVTIVAHQGLIARAKLHEVLLEVLRACRDLEGFVSRLPKKDAGRRDFELALVDFEAFVKRHTPP